MELWLLDASFGLGCNQLSKQMQNGMLCNLTRVSIGQSQVCSVCFRLRNVLQLNLRNEYASGLSMGAYSIVLVEDSWQPFKQCQGPGQVNYANGMLVAKNH